jgi:hypothetical protein
MSSLLYVKAQHVLNNYNLEWFNERLRPQQLDEEKSKHIENMPVWLGKIVFAEQAFVQSLQRLVKAQQSLTPA